jgi:hypothetical protein
VKHKGNQEYEGLSTDTKPLAADTAVNATFAETDTRKQYYSDGTDWILQDLVRFSEFRIFKDGATTYIIDRVGRVQQSNTDTQVAVQAQIDSMPGATVYEFLWDANFFTMNNPITHPSITTSGGVKKVIHKGSAVIGQRLASGGTTCLVPSATFPTNRYLFELNNPGAASTSSGQLAIDGIQATNSTNFPTINVGFVKMEAGGALNGQNNWVVRNCYGSYMWRCIHLIGNIWHGRFEDNSFTSGNATFLGDAGLILEDGGHTDFLNPTPKDCRFISNRFMHSEGTQQDCIRIQSGGYNIFENLFIDGFKYINAVITLNNTDTLDIHNNTFKDITVVDLRTPTPDIRQAGLYIAGTSVYDNVFRNLRIAPNPETIKIVGTGAVRNDIEFSSYFGAVSRVTDTGTDGNNVLRPIAGALPSGVNSPIVHTGGLSRVIDSRPGATAAGSQTITGNGSTLQFDFAHGMFGTPAYAVVVAGSASIMNNPFWVTWTAANLRVTFNTAPPAGTHTLRFITGVYK